jgi:ParB/RepB/Spo0J family partition protein
MEPKLAHVKLSDIIVSETNKMFRDESELSDVALKELIDSVKLHGVIQPIVLRPTGDKKFEVVAGERRFRAALSAELATIPANIRELTDEEAFEVQVTENLQRKDVHPLREAHAYKFLVDKDPVHNTPLELALKFGKTEHYITTRLKLNDLVPDAKKDFQENLMTIGHALIIARLQPTDQQAVIRDQAISYRDGKKQVKFYPPIQELEEHINDSIICSLADAAFKTDDTKLLPKAGACLTCPKRSGANQLFADVKDKDRCFDPACFLAKRMKYMATQIAGIMEKEPDTVFLQAWRNTTVDPEVQKALKDNKAKVLTSFETYSYGDSKVKVKGIYINGDEVGKRATVYIKGSAATAGSKAAPEVVNVKEAIARINERLERAVELDDEKVYGRILEALKNHPTQENPDINYYNDAEEVFLNFVLYDKLSYSDKEEVAAKLKLPEDDGDEDYSAKLFSALKALDTADRMFLLRRLMLGSYGGNMPHMNYPFFIRKIAEGYKDIPIAQFTADQEAARVKREASAAKRIAALKPAKAEKKKKVKEVSNG